MKPNYTVKKVPVKKWTVVFKPKTYSVVKIYEAKDPKKCPICKIIKFPRQFGKNKRNTDGLKMFCAHCEQKLRRSETA